nr:hypothetical protein [Lachnospiraceae bacterium]
MRKKFFGRVLAGVLALSMVLTGNAVDFVANDAAVADAKVVLTASNEDENNYTKAQTIYGF